MLEVFNKNTIMEQHFYVFGSRVCQNFIAGITNNILLGLLISIYKNHVHSLHNTSMTVFCGLF